MELACSGLPSMSAFCRRGGATLFQLMEEARMQWSTPSYTDVRLGFEIVMYVATR
ncbi:coenzyme PQQ precursor peptide PqqA [Burkholderia sp. SRS-W-2-2016]|nr:coenzyme PQQ precursor peptide PqqA [Burkholderia sp. SRS-W-2-2016]